jgi:hypothetical protein
MPHDETLAARIRAALSDAPGLAEKKMFGGLCFMLRGHMCCGILGDELVLRLPPALADEALRRTHVRPMDFTGRPMRGFIYVASGGLKTDRDLRAWLKPALDFALALPPKSPGKKPRRAARRSP